MIDGRDICVVGGGVAGLSVALALARRGARVTVLEQAPRIAEVGAGLQVSPNGGRVLDALGLGAAFRDISGESAAVALRDASGRIVLRMPLGGRGRFALVHRADLIEVLRAGAVAEGVRVETGQRVEAVDMTERGASRLRLADGTERDAHLLVGADGLRSRLRAALLGRRDAEFTGQVAWRALVPAPPGVPAEAQVFMAPGRHVVAYPLRGASLLNIVAVEERGDWTAEGWHHAGDPEAMRARFAGFGGPVPAWLDRLEACMVWGLFRHPVAERWHGNGIVLLGDAAHPTLPFLAQGACMALEDAWVLAESLASAESDAEAFSRYQARRLARVRRIVNAATANARNYHLGGVQRRIAHAALRAVGAVSPGFMLGRFDWLYGYDPTR